MKKKKKLKHNFYKLHNFEKKQKQKVKNNFYLLHNFHQQLPKNCFSSQTFKIFWFVTFLPTRNVPYSNLCPPQKKKKTFFWGWGRVNFFWEGSFNFSKHHPKFFWTSCLIAIGVIFFWFCNLKKKKKKGIEKSFGFKTYVHTFWTLWKSCLNL